MELFPPNSNINFMRLRFVSLAFAAIVMFVAIGGMVFKGFNFALDFTGGYETEVQFSKTVDVGELRGKLQCGYHGWTYDLTGKVKGVRFDTLSRICAALGCKPGDILDFVEGPEPEAGKGTAAADAPTEAAAGTPPPLSPA